MRAVLSVLPYAGIIRLSFACWMLSNSTIFSAHGGLKYVPFNIPVPGLPDKSVSYITYQYFLSSYQYYWGGEDAHHAFLEARVFQPQVFPLFVVLVLILLAKLAIKFFQHVSPHRGIFKAIYWYFQKISCLKKKKIASVDENGSLLGFRLTELDDDLRQEVHTQEFSFSLMLLCGLLFY